MQCLKRIHQLNLSRRLATLGFIFLLVTSMARGSACPRDLFIGTHACFTVFTLSYQRMKQSQQKLCCGLDVETLRSLCRAYVDSMACVDKVKSQCPAEKHNEIEKALVNLDGAREELSGLCSDDTIVENYAMHQSCLTAAGPRSETCLARHLEGRGGRSNIRFLNLIKANTVDAFCSKIRNTITCVQENVDYVCGQQAASLVPSLVRPMVRYSASCVSGPSKHPTKRPFLMDDTFIQDDPPVDRGSRSSSSSSSYRSMDDQREDVDYDDRNRNKNGVGGSYNGLSVGSETNEDQKQKPKVKNCSSVQRAIHVFFVLFLLTTALIRSML